MGIIVLLFGCHGEQIIETQQAAPQKIVPLHRPLPSSNHYIIWIIYIYIYTHLGNNCVCVRILLNKV